MSSDWQILTIQECASSDPYSTQIGPFGKALMADQYKSSGVPVLRGVNVNFGRFNDADFVFVDESTADALAKFESFPDDVLLVHKGTLGKIGIMPRRRKFARYIMGNSMMRVRCNQELLLPEYLYYWLSSSAGQQYIFSRVSQVGVPQIQTPLSTLRKAELLVPPVFEQRKITEVLGALDDKIDLLREANATLEAIAQALFRSWFVEFDPVRAKTEGRDPEGLPPEVADLFPNEFEESEFGTIPKGWRIGTLADFADLNPESWTNKVHPSTLLYVDLANTKDNWIEAVTEYRFEDAPSRARRVLRSGDTIVGTVRPGNRSFAFVQNPPSALTASTGFAVLRPVNQFTAEFVFIAATRQESIDRLAHLADGAAYPAVRPEVVQSLSVVIAPQGVLAAFHEIAHPLYRKSTSNMAEIVSLADLRDTLLPRLMSGKLCVSECEEVTI